MLMIILTGVAGLFALVAVWCLIEVGLRLRRWLRDEPEDWTQEGGGSHLW